MGNKLETEGSMSPRAAAAAAAAVASEDTERLQTGLPVQRFDISFPDLLFRREIGSGQFGTVYKGSYFGTPVAIKKLKRMTDHLTEEQTQKYIDREVAMLKSCNHPHIVLFMGLCMHEGIQYIVMEYVKGITLRDAIFPVYLSQSGKSAQQIKLTFPQKARIAYQLAQVMSFLHQKGLVHRDLKPENLLLTRNLDVKLCDMGLSRTYAAQTARHVLRMTSVGSSDYMAPEVKLGELYGEKCDVFGFGVVLGVMLAEQRPPVRTARKLFKFSTRDWEKLLPADCPHALANVMFDCCEEFEKDRPSFSDICQKLKDYLRQVKTECEWQPAKASLKKSKKEDDKRRKKRTKSTNRRRGGTETSEDGNMAAPALATVRETQDPSLPTTIVDDDSVAQQLTNGDT